MRTVKEIMAEIENDTSGGMDPHLTGIWLELFHTITKGITISRLEEICKADSEGRLAVLPCKVGDPYTGICREQIPGKKGWETKEWLEHGTVVSFDIVAELTAEKTKYNHFRNIDEVGEAWFVGEGHREAAEKALGGGEG